MPHGSMLLPMLFNISIKTVADITMRSGLRMACNTLFLFFISIRIPESVSGGGGGMDKG